MRETDKLAVLTNPSLSEAAELMVKAFAQRKTLIVAGNCRVRYVGRANSTLEPGERLLIIKADGSLLVHRPVGYEPVNWQPQGSVFHVHAREGTLEVHAVRQKPRENVSVVFSSVQMVSALSLDDSGEFLLYASEEDMHRAILLKPTLLEEGFTPISYEKKVEPGFVDVYGVDKAGRLVVVEVKRKTAGKEAALQLAKYIDAVKAKANREIRGVLAAPSLGKDVQRLLETLGLEFKALDPKKCAAVLKKAGTAKLETFFREKSQ
ncbi:MAG: endonuclease NucS [Candidatus Bathyarchaeota archaeon]|nr:endonuclease NucS [Candidatus Bathyarchaeota archaeon]